MTYKSQRARVSIFNHKNILCGQISTPGTWAWPHSSHKRSTHTESTRDPQIRPTGPQLGPRGQRETRAKITQGGWWTVALGTRSSWPQVQTALNSLSSYRQNPQQRIPIWSQESVRNYTPSWKTEHGTSVHITSKAKWLGLNVKLCCLKDTA